MNQANDYLKVSMPTGRLGLNTDFSQTGMKVEYSNLALKSGRGASGPMRIDIDGDNIKIELQVEAGEGIECRYEGKFLHQISENLANVTPMGGEKTTAALVSAFRTKAKGEKRTVTFAVGMAEADSPNGLAAAKYTMMFVAPMKHFDGKYHTFKKADGYQFYLIDNENKTYANEVTEGRMRITGKATDEKMHLVFEATLSDGSTVTGDYYGTLQNVEYANEVTEGRMRITGKATDEKMHLVFEATLSDGSTVTGDYYGTLQNVEDMDIVTEGRMRITGKATDEKMHLVFEATLSDGSTVTGDYYGTLQNVEDMDILPAKNAYTYLSSSGENENKKIIEVIYRYEEIHQDQEVKKKQHRFGFKYDEWQEFGDLSSSGENENKKIIEVIYRYEEIHQDQEVKKKQHRFGFKYDEWQEFGDYPPLLEVIIDVEALGVVNGDLIHQDQEVKKKQHRFGFKYDEWQEFGDYPPLLEVIIDVEALGVVNGDLATTPGWKINYESFQVEYIAPDDPNAQHKTQSKGTVTAIKVGENYRINITAETIPANTGQKAASMELSYEGPVTIVE